MGAVPLSAGMGWAGFLFSAMCFPPILSWLESRWRAMWLQRLNKLPLFQERWLRHKWRDGY
jgi:hypothetical protein